jgi:hypothetical protein
VSPCAVTLADHGAPERWAAFGCPDRSMRLACVGLRVIGVRTIATKVITLTRQSCPGVTSLCSRLDSVETKKFPADAVGTCRSTRVGGRQPRSLFGYLRAVTIIGLEARHADRLSTPMSPYEKWPRGTPSHHRGLVDVRHSADEVSMVSPATPTSLDRQSKRVLVDSAEWRDRLEQLAEMRYAATISIPSEETSLGLNRAARHPST